jgi:hypothetical protein
VNNSPEQIQVANKPLAIDFVNQPVEIRGADYAKLELRTYENGARHWYAIDQTGTKPKARHISHDTILDAYGYGPNSTNSESDATSITAIDTDVEVSKTAEVTETLSTNSTITEALGAAAMAASSDRTANADAQRKGLFDRFRKTDNKPNRHLGRKLAKVAAFATALGLAGVAVAGSQMSSESASAQGTTTTEKAADATTTTAAAETTTTTSPENKALRDSINAEALAKIGLKEGQYTEITDLDAAFPGTLEANHFSMNHGPQAWNGLNRTPNGAKELSAKILSEDGFTESDADVVTEALKKHGLSDELIEQLADGDYSNVEFKFYKLNGSRILYHGMSYNNNGTLGTEDQRVVSPGDSDAISVMAPKGTDLKVPFRIDCGGSNAQPFGSVTIETPSTPKTTPETTPTTHGRTTTTHGRTTTTHGRTTTTHGRTTTTSTPPTTKPKSATTVVPGGPNTTVKNDGSGPPTTKKTTTSTAGNTTTTYRVVTTS